MRKMLKYFLDEKGQSLVIAAASMLVILGLSAATVDVGYLFFQRRDLQTAADTAALAGARVLYDSNGSDESGACDTALEYALLNGSEEIMTEVNVINDYNYEGKSIQVVEVTTGRESGLFFARLFGFNSQDVGATAVATWSYITEAGESILPLFVNADHLESLGSTLPMAYELHVGADNPGANWGYFNLNTYWQISDATATALRGDLDPLNPPIRAISSWSGYESWNEGDYAQIPAEFLYETETGKIANIADNIAEKSVGTPTKFGRLYRHYEYDDENDYTRLEGIVPLVRIIPTGSSGLMEVYVEGFLGYRIHDCISNNAGEGSLYSTPEIRARLSFTGQRGSTRIPYPQYVGSEHAGTVIGDLLFELDDITYSGQNISQSGMGLKFTALIK